MNINKLPALGALKYFKVAAEQLSFKLAADQLFVTQAAISQHIKSLENQVGCKLFIRRNREVSLTPQGQILLPYVQKAFREIHKGLSQLEEDNHPNVLKITVLPSIATFWLIPRLHLFRAEHPELQVKLIPNSSVVNFDNFNLDVAIRYGEGKYENLESKYLVSDQVYLVAHPNLVSPNMMPADLQDLPVITENYHDTNDAWQQFLADHRFSFKYLKNRFEIRDSTPAMVGAVLAGQGVAMVRRSLVLDYLKNGQLIHLFGFSHPCEWSYYMVAPEYHFSFPKVQAFETWLRNAVNDFLN